MTNRSEQITPAQIARFVSGSHLTPHRLNQIVDQVNQFTGVRPPQHAEGNAGIASEKSSAAFPLVRQFQINALYTDYVICNPYADGAADTSTLVSVAKPWILRSRSSRNGVSYTYTGTAARTADDGATSESQVVIPDYIIGDIIYGIYNIIGGTGVSYTSGQDTIYVDWLDLNVDGRMWAEVPA